MIIPSGSGRSLRRPKPSLVAFTIVDGRAVVVVVVAVTVSTVIIIFYIVVVVVVDGRPALVVCTWSAIHCFTKKKQKREWLAPHDQSGRVDVVP